MAPRFVAFVRTDPPPDDFGARTGLVRRHSRNDLQIYASDAASVATTPDGDAVAVGTVFARHGGCGRLSKLPSNLIQSIRASPRDVVESIWGGYVLFQSDATADAVHLLRDPLGALPCYRTDWGGGEILASDVGILVASDLFTPEVDFNALGRHLWSLNRREAATCLVGLSELLPGEGLTVAEAGLETWRAWSPWDHVTPSGPAPDRAGALREVVARSVASWGSCYGRILVSVSGGLDSSIVAASLLRSGRAFSGFTMVADDADGDERPYARLLMTALGRELHEVAYRIDLADLYRSSATHLPRPLGHPHIQAMTDWIREAGRSQGIDAVFNGMGGDNVFCLQQSALPVIDRLHSEGWRAAFATARDVAHVSGAGLPAVGLQALRMRSRGRRSGSGGGPTALLRRGAGYETVGVHDDWLTPPPDTLPGKSHHVEMIGRVLSFVEGLDRGSGVSAVSPLLSQPVVEFCLGIPSWQWCAGGENRAVARAAFAPWMPGAIVHRRSKGGPDAFSRDLCLARWDQLRDILMEGQLVRNGIVDPSRVEFALQEEVMLRSGLFHDLLLLTDVEAWIAHHGSPSRGRGR